MFLSDTQFIWWPSASEQYTRQAYGLKVFEGWSCWQMGLVYQLGIQEWPVVQVLIQQEEWKFHSKFAYWFPRAWARWNMKLKPSLMRGEIACCGHFRRDWETLVCDFPFSSFSSFSFSFPTCYLVCISQPSFLSLIREFMLFASDDKDCFNCRLVWFELFRLIGVHSFC